MEVATRLLQRREWAGKIEAVGSFKTLANFERTRLKWIFSGVLIQLVWGIIFGVLYEL